MQRGRGRGTVRSVVQVRGGRDEAGEIRVTLNDRFSTSSREAVVVRATGATPRRNVTAGYSTANRFAAQMAARTGGARTSFISVGRGLARAAMGRSSRGGRGQVTLARVGPPRGRLLASRAVSNPTVRAPGGLAPGGRATGGRAPGGRAPGGRAPGGRAPGGRTPGGRAPGGSALGGRAPGGRAPGGRAPGGRAPGGRAPGGRAPGGRVQGGRGGRGRGGGDPVPSSSKDEMDDDLESWRNARKEDVATDDARKEDVAADEEMANVSL